MNYTVKVSKFEGPFDLLLFFIQRDELDIQDIPIAKITNDFLEYIKVMESLNVDLASEFILVAASLMRIKAKMLIPRKELDEEGNEIDPRLELVERLMEYKRYKGVIDELKTLEEKRSKQQERGNITNELQQIASKAMVDAELESLTLFKLMKTFHRVLERYENGQQAAPKHTVVQYNYTIEGQRNYIFETVQQQAKTSFSILFEICKTRLHAIFTFLALLELIQMQKVTILIGEGRNNFWLNSRSN